jgi:RND superfamily putative drug exporter
MSEDVAPLPDRRRNLAGAAGAWSARHRGLVIAGWLVFVVTAYLAGGLIGQKNLTDAQMGNGTSGRATRIYEQAFPYHTREEVLVQGKGAVRLGNPVFTGAVTDLVRRLHGLPTVSDIQSPLLPANGALRSSDGRSMLVTFSLAGDSNQAQSNVAAPLAAVAATAQAYPQLNVAEFGTASANKALIKAYDHDFQTAEHSSLPITLLILVLAFGSLVAAGVPLLLGLTAVIAALGLIAPLSHLVPVAQGQIGPVVLLIGLAVGVDYSMFYLRRKLEERHAGADGATALTRAASTSGQAVLISGMTVMTAMAGMLLAGNAVFTSLGMGTMLVVAVAVLGSVTVLPAVMSRLGDSIEKGRVPILARRRARGPSPVWNFLVRGVLRVPLLSMGLATGLLVLAALPALGMRTVDPGTVGLPRNLPIMSTYQKIETAFPGAPMSALVVVQSPDSTTTAVRSSIAAMTRQAVATGQMSGPIIQAVSPDRKIAVVTISLAGNGTDSRSTAALRTLRNRVIPATVGSLPGTHAYVTGLTAGSVDFNHVMKSHLPLVFGFVLGLAFLLMLVTFRSVVIPLMTIVLNVLSVSAAYGLMVLIFQHGYLRSALGAQNISGIIDWIPLFLFVVLFGLSMDYHVLILSRIREGHQRGLSTTEAVTEGITTTAGVITSAAVVMVAVFALFAGLNEIIFKQLGVALALAVLIDATVVRIVLLPSVMKVLGKWNWYFPRLARPRRAEPLSTPPAMRTPTNADERGAA